MPAKVQSYLACGKPIIASLDGSGAKIVIEAESGVVAPAEDSVLLSKKIKKLIYLDKSRLLEMGNNGRAYYEKEFDKEFLLEKLEAIFNSK
ncbi:glycosyltransferase [Flavobacteriaceae bacterium]|nr:glycosyltransferase [Flavobacteriaceae bacterium]